MVKPGNSPDKTRDPDGLVIAHPSAAQLGGYAGGSLCDGLSLLVASHLTFCPACRTSVARIEAICGGLLEVASGEPSEPGAVRVVWERIEADPAEAPSAPARHGRWPEPEILPKPLLDRIARSGGRWRLGLPGFAEYRLAEFADEQVSLLRARGGMQIPAHTHSGSEATLVLSGRLRDGDTVHSRGDVALADETCDHRPQVAEGETCVCLIVLAGRLRFTGRFARALNLFHA